MDASKEIVVEVKNIRFDSNRSIDEIKSEIINNFNELPAHRYKDGNTSSFTLWSGTFFIEEPELEFEQFSEALDEAFHKIDSYSVSPNRGRSIEIRRGKKYICMLGRYQDAVEQASFIGVNWRHIDDDVIAAFNEAVKRGL